MEAMKNTIRRKNMIQLRIIPAFALLLILAVILGGCASKSASDEKIPVKVLILPVFEVEHMAGDFPGEAQFYYEEYLQNGEKYNIDGVSENSTLYYKDGIALFMIDEGKVSSALNTSAVLADERFDFSDAYILSTGCAGSAEGYGIPGDVYVITATVDYDLGHHADPREMAEDSDTTWFHDETYDASTVVRLNSELTDRAFDMVKDVPLETTELTEKYLQKVFPGETWANRKPKVMRGTSVTGDNYWKGAYDHQNALLITDTYGCPDPYAATDMEDIAVSLAVDRAGMLDRLIILRDSVNMDVFPPGVTPEHLWGPKDDDELASEDSEESFDIFATAMENNFKAGRIIIEAIMHEEL